MKLSHHEISQESSYGVGIIPIHITIYYLLTSGYGCRLTNEKHPLHLAQRISEAELAIGLLVPR